MRCFYTITLLLLFLFSQVSDTLQTDVSSTELAMIEWSSSLRVVYCTDKPLPDMMVTFRIVMAKFVNLYCNKNRTACNLNDSTLFGPREVMMLDGFPRREAAYITIKYAVLYPNNASVMTRAPTPFLHRKVLSDIFQLHHRKIELDFGWIIEYFDKYPRFDSMTEFMNIAIIPIVVISLPLMVCLAYWVSTLRPNSGSDTWMVTGSAGGKNAALRRTMEIIAEQNEEYERQQRYALTKNVAVTSGHEGITTTGELLLNVASLKPRDYYYHEEEDETDEVPQNKLSMASSQPTSVQSPQIFIQAGSSSSSSHPRTSIVSLSHGKELLHVKPKHSRRPSSVEEIKKARRLRGHRRSDAKQWKSGSLMLAGFRRT